MMISDKTPTTLFWLYCNGYVKQEDLTKEEWKSIVDNFDINSEGLKELMRCSTL